MTEIFMKLYGSPLIRLKNLIVFFILIVMRDVLY